MKNIVGLLCLAGLLCFAAPAKADHIDEIRSKDVSLYCISEVTVWKDGFNHRMNGAERILRHIDRVDAIRRHNNGEQPPTDGIYMIEWDSYTSQEQEWIKLNMFKGWDAANKMLNEKEEVNDQKFALLAQKNYESCLYEEAKRRTNRDNMKDTWLNKTYDWTTGR